jgi:hypothetical protein
MRSVHGTTGAWKALSITYFWACVCACVALLTQYVTRRSHIVCGLCLHHVFRHYLINRTIFRKKLLDIKCVFWFSLQRLFKTFPILGRNERDIVINMKTSLCTSHYSYRILMKLEFSGQIFGKNFNIKFHQNSSSWSRVVACGQLDRQTQTDRQTDRQADMKLIVPVRNIANAPKNYNTHSSPS